MRVQDDGRERLVNSLKSFGSTVPQMQHTCFLSKFELFSLTCNQYVSELYPSIPGIWVCATISLMKLLSRYFNTLIAIKIPLTVMILTSQCFAFTSLSP